MSSILEEAVIHANTLREAAIKNAEQIVIEKYSSDIKDAVEKLLEGTEEIMEAVPFAHEDLLESEEKKSQIKIPVKDITGQEETSQGMNEEIDIDLEQIKSMLSESEAEEEEEIHLEEEAGGEEEEEEIHLEEDQAGGSYEEEEEEYNLEEAIQFDHKVVPTGWLGVNQYHLEEAELFDAVSRIAKESMKKLEQENKKEREKLQKENEDLKEKANQLAENYKKLNKVVQSLKEKLVESNTTNGKLFYTNCVLKDPSLNERQKEKLVENLSNAQSLEQAKVIYETLNSVGSTNSSIQKPKSLSEALNRNSSLVVSPRRTEERKETDPVSDRWKRLAGL